MSPTPPEGSDGEGLEPTGVEPEEPTSPDVASSQATTSPPDADSPVGRHAARRRARKRRRRIVFMVLGVFLLVLIGLVAWYEIESHPFGSEGRDEIVRISDGESADAVGSALQARGVIGSALAFRVSSDIHGTPKIEPGSYLFKQNQSFGTVRAILDKGPDVFTFRVRPGFTLAEEIERIPEVPYPSQASFAKAVKDGSVHSPFEPSGSSDLEGLIGTGIYQVIPGETGRQLLSQMVSRFDLEAKAAGLTPAAAKRFGLTLYEMVTVASVVEKEGYIPKNMGMVARVVYNRLAANMALQMDSTVLYYLGQDGGTVTPADLKVVTPYNTYLNKGLPPTPICTPSTTALASAVNPPEGAWLYYVLISEDGTMQFSDTYAEQLAAEQLAASRGVG